MARCRISAKAELRTTVLNTLVSNWCRTGAELGRDQVNIVSDPASRLFDPASRLFDLAFDAELVSNWCRTGAEVRAFDAESGVSTLLPTLSLINLNFCLHAFPFLSFHLVAPQLDTSSAPDGHQRVGYGGP